MADFAEGKEGRKIFGERRVKVGASELGSGSSRLGRNVLYSWGTLGGTGFCRKVHGVPQGLAFCWGSRLCKNSCGLAATHESLPLLKGKHSG